MWRAQIWDRCTRDELDALVFEDFFFTTCELYIAEARTEVCNLLLVRCVERNELATAALNGARHTIDMSVVESDHTKLDRVLGFLR